MLNIRFQGLRLVPSQSADLEMLNLGLMIEDCKDILEQGYAPRKRAKGTVEKWLDCKNKTYNIVVVKLYNFLYQEDVYLITHIGRFTKRK